MSERKYFPAPVVAAAVVMGIVGWVVGSLYDATEPTPVQAPAAETISTQSVSGTGRVEFVPGCEDVRAIKVLNAKNEVVGTAHVVVQPPYTCVFNFQMGGGK